MSYADDEEAIGGLLRQTYRPVSLPPGVREQIRERLVAEIECYVEGSGSMWTRPSLVIPILASIASGLIAYGCWISMALA